MKFVTPENRGEGGLQGTSKRIKPSFHDVQAEKEDPGGLQIDHSLLSS